MIIKTTAKGYKDAYDFLKDFKKGYNYYQSIFFNKQDLIDFKNHLKNIGEKENLLSFYNYLVLWLAFSDEEIINSVLEVEKDKYLTDFRDNEFIVYKILN